ncbi:ABC transporter permease [Chitinophaga filiformis]|uniref:ABC transporter permease n=1 Tax=Chitinophaga filiformis TaxID=104663 RepID=A0ABY4I9N0_CHIFI|nr:ABC transporter permease [Chitinophaga filiformis]UPK72813.1 ABC transporter permease [Chitinophaga filiformis]
MIRNFLKIAFRNLAKNKTFSAINIIGLAIGTLCCIYIVMYVSDQYSYDKHHNRAGDIYRVNSWTSGNGNESNNATGSPPVAPAMKNDFAEVEQYTRLVPTDRLGAKQHLLSYRQKSVYEKNAVYVDSTFFEVFNYHFVYGNGSDALKEPNAVVLLKPAAEKLFGQENPVGKLIQVDNAYGKQSLKVTGVIDESLGKSHIQANMFMSMNSGGMGSFTYTSTAWAAYNYALSYIRLRPNANVAALEKKLPAFLAKYGAEQLKEMGMQKRLTLQPVSSIHTTLGYRNELSKTVDSSFLNMLLLIAALVQIIACINFMNLSTARASRRAKEVGVRKVIGARVNDLVKQFLCESMMLSMLGLLAALPALVLALPYLNRLTGADISLSFLTSYKFWLLLAGTGIFTGLLAGSYPAFYLSAFMPIRVLKGNFRSHLSSVGIRRSLVVFQFALSVIFISAIIVIYSQLNYIKNKDLGFEKAQKIVFSFYTDDIKSKIPAFSNDLRQLAGIDAVSQADNFPSQLVSHDWPYFLEGSNGAAGADVQFIWTDQHYAKALGIRLAGGRDFRANDSGKVLINEAFARKLGLDPSSAPGKRLYPQEDGGPVSFVEIAGVMKDFNYNSLHNDVKPLMLRYNPALATDDIIVSANTTDYKGLLEKIGLIWQRQFPAVPFEYAFIDEEVQKLYETELTLSGIINSFTAIAIFISCLGLFGLAAFNAEQRSKEIGIRKVLGASLLGISTLLSKDFLKLVGIAFVVATPIAWWATDRWLDAFSYRITPSWWMFALAGSLAMLITLCTVGIQAFKAAVANPVKSLKMDG